MVQPSPKKPLNMYQSACSAATTGSCAEPERDRDGLISHEPAVAPVEVR